MEDVATELETMAAVVLDVGGVLMLPRPDFIGPILEAHGFEAPEDGTFHRAHYVAARAYDHGSDDPEVWNDYLFAYLEVLGVPTDAAQDVHRAIDELFRDPSHPTWSWPRSEAVEAMRKMAEADLPLAVVSNSNGTVEEMLAAAGVCQVGPGPGVEVTVIVDSEVVGIQKPDPGIFSYALDALGIGPEDAVYVGDTLRNDVAGARAAGLTPVQIDPYDLHEGDHLRLRGLAELLPLLGR